MGWFSFYLSQQQDKAANLCLLQVNFIFLNGCLLNHFDSSAWEQPAEEHKCSVLFKIYFYCVRLTLMYFLGEKTKKIGPNLLGIWTFPVKHWPSSTPTKSWRTRGFSLLPASVQGGIFHKYLSVLVLRPMLWAKLSAAGNKHCLQCRIPKCCRRSDQNYSRWPGAVTPSEYKLTDKEHERYKPAHFSSHTEYIFSPDLKLLPQ